MTIARVSLTARDEMLFRALDRCALTVRQLRAMSQTFPVGFGSDRRLQDRLMQLTRAGLLRRFRYASLHGTGQLYYTLTPESFCMIHGNDAELPAPGAFREVGIARHHHAFSLAEFIVATSVAAHEAGATMENFTRENAMKLSADCEDLFPDCTFTLCVPGRPPFQFYVELDNSTEVLASSRARESWLRKLRIYEQLQNMSATRFRVLGIATRSKKRLENISALAASVAGNKQRALFLGAFLPDYLGNAHPLTTPLFVDHRGLRVSLLPTSLPFAQTGVVMPIAASTKHALTMIGA